MFKKQFLGRTDIQSSWKSTRSEREAGSQTSTLEVAESECQAKETESVEVQTDDLSNIPIVFAPYDEGSLTEFLRRVGPPICRELEKNGRSHAFEGYNLNSDEKEHTISKIHTLSYKTFTKQQLCCTGLSWNSTGAVLAAIYGFPDHEDWCEHRGGLCTWNLNRKDFKSDQPNKVIEYSCCLTSVKFHPEEPALVVVGNFVGEVILWNLSLEDDMMVAVTETGSSGHHETVTCVEWIKDPESKIGQYLVVSCGLDGRILFWKKDDRTQKLQIVHAFVLRAENLPRSVRLRSSRLNAEIGVTSLSFNSEDPSMFLIGSEGGGVFQCSVNSQAQALTDTEFSVPLRNPVVLAYHPHQGQVHSVHCSPFARNIFLTCGSDMDVRIYSLNQANKSNLALTVGETFARVQWSPIRPAVFGGITEKGHLCLFDLLSNRSKPVATVSITEPSQSAWHLDFNRKDPMLISTATSDGAIQVWSLLKYLVSPSAQEQAVLKELGELNQE